MFKKTFVFAAVSLALAAAPAMAGHKRMKNAEGTKVSIDCDSTKCAAKTKAKGGKWTVEKTTAPGTEEFENLISEYKGKGFK